MDTLTRDIARFFAQDAEWDESKVKRDDEGKFAKQAAGPQPDPDSQAQKNIYELGSYAGKGTLTNEALAAGIKGVMHDNPDAREFGNQWLAALGVAIPEKRPDRDKRPFSERFGGQPATFDLTSDEAYKLNDRQEEAYRDLGRRYRPNLEPGQAARTGSALRVWAGPDYQRIKRNLRNDEGAETSVVRDLDLATRQFELPEDVEVVRGLTLPPAIKEGQQPEDFIGHEFTDKSFVSTSLMTRISASFARNKSGGVMSIRLPKGTRCAHLGAQVGLDGEGELLLPRDGTYRIVDAKSDGFSYRQGFGGIPTLHPIFRVEYTPSARATAVAGGRRDAPAADQSPDDDAEGRFGWAWDDFIDSDTAEDREFREEDVKRDKSGKFATQAGSGEPSIVPPRISAWPTQRGEHAALRDKVSDIAREYRGSVEPYAFGGRASLEQTKAEKAELKNQAIKDIAGVVGKVMGVDAGRVTVTDETYEFTLGDRKGTAAGTANRETGEIKLYKQEPGAQVAEVLVHEMMHVKWQNTLDRMGEEYTVWVADSRDNDDARPREERVMDGAGFFTEVGKKKYPLAAAKERLLTGRNLDRLRKEDGITDYSREWWAAFEKNDADMQQAIHETLAEMAKLDYQDVLPNLLWYKQGRWRVLYNLVNKTYKAERDPRGQASDTEFHWLGDKRYRSAA